MWTKSQKISATVLALAAGAFAVDRWVLERPAEAAEVSVAAPASPAANRAAAPKPAAAEATAPAATQAVTLASRLAEMGEARRFSYEPAGDAFRPCDDWLAQVPSTALAAPAGEAAPGPGAAKRIDHAEVFRSRHTLNAVMTKQSGGMAIVDGKLYAPGQTIDGFKLVKVDETEATLTGKGTTVTLRLATQAGASTATATAR